MNFNQDKNGQQTEGLTTQTGVRIPNIEGDKTIQCWSCQTIMMVKDEWNVVQCPTCEKVCKIPEDKNSVKSQLRKLQLNGNLNHFDVDMPFVYAILICPYCRTDNKVRINSEHMVCYKCHNSMNITQEHGKLKMTTGKYIGDKQNKIYSEFPPVNFPHQKSLRFSDLFFPDPMFYPGYYPAGDSFSPLYPRFDPQMVDEYFRRRARYEAYKYHLSKDNKRTPVRDKLDEIKKNLNINSVAEESINENRKFSSITGYENKIENIRDKLMQNKREKNQAILMGLLGKIK